MARRGFERTLTTVIVLWLVSISVSAQNPITWPLKTSSPETSLKPGDTFEAHLTATIEKGWPLYALTQAEGGPIPTRITLPDGQPFALTGQIKSSPSYTEHDPNFDLETEFFEESATFTLPIKVAVEAKAGSHVLLVQVRFQACNDRVCLPPAIVNLTAEVTVTAD